MTIMPAQIIATKFERYIEDKSKDISDATYCYQYANQQKEFFCFNIQINKYFR